MNRTSHRSRRWRDSMVLRAASDGPAVVVACLFALVLRFDLSLSRLWLLPSVLLAVAYGALVLFAGTALGLYRRRWHYASFEEMRAIAVANLVGMAVILTADLLDADVRAYMPLGAVMICAGFSIIAMGAVRFVSRVRDEGRRDRAGSTGRAVIVAGAGDAGERIVWELRAHPESGRRPVALLDDDPQKRNLEFGGVRVLGRLTDLAEVASSTGAEEVLIAIPSADGPLVASLTDQAHRSGLKTTVLPGSLELLGLDHAVGVGDIRNVSIVDLLGRKAIDRQLTNVADYVLGRRVLVTGAGGSIGGELCRQLQRLNPHCILLFDHDESNLHGLQLELKGRALLDVPELIIGDVRDLGRLQSVMGRWRPDVVFHVAAHKHLPLLELHACEAVKTNVLGTLNVARTAAVNGAGYFINVSTDKAAEPTSVLGATKRIAELSCQHLGAEFPDTVFTSVRFGNVLGSRGSVVPLFERQIERGGPVTITHPEATRYFMTIQEAAQLVVHAGGVAKGGEVFILDMGEPVRVLDLARRMIDLAGATGRIGVTYTGLRPGEKLHEELFFADELHRTSARVDDRMWVCTPGDLSDRFAEDLASLGKLASADDDMSIGEALARIVPTYQRAKMPFLGDLYPDGL